MKTNSILSCFLLNKFKMMTLLLVSILLVSCSSKTKTVSEDAWEKYHLSAPTTYVVNEFQDHDVIFIGETHRKRNDLIFLQQLIPQLYNKGVYKLFYEFASYEDNAKIDSLLNAKEYDENEFKNIIQNNFWEWPYKEYIDVFKVIWQINKKHTNGKKFKLIAIGNSNSKSFPQAFKEWTEKDWANLILKETVDKNEKGLVYCGNHHAVTKYKQPVLINGKFSKFIENERVGQLVYNKIGNRTMNIWIHFPWGNQNLDPIYFSLLRTLDSLSLSVDSTHEQYAFNTNNSELGELIDSISYYSYGYKKIKLKEITDGYIVLRPICKEDFVTYFPNFTEDENLNFTNKQIKFYYNYPPFTTSQANDTLRKWYMKDSVEFYNFRKRIKNCR